MSSKKCADKILIYLKQSKRIQSSLHTLKRKHIHTRSHINPFEHSCYHNNTHRQILSFCTTQIKTDKAEQNESDEYEYEYEDEYESEEDDEDGEASEYEYEYETDDEEFKADDDEQRESNQNELESKDNSEISENFDFETYSENILSELFSNLPENGRIDGKPVEQFISALILSPLEVFEDEIHNKFILMHNDMDALFESAYQIPIENESELRDVIDLAFDKLNIYTSYIDNHFNLRHSPKHYLMRQIRVNHGKIVFLSMRKIMYHKYPEWAQSDNWAVEELGDRNRRSFIVSENDEYDENENVESEEQQ